MSQADEESVFHRARQIASPGDRADYLREACGANAALRERVVALLAVHEREQSLLRSRDSAVAAVPEPISEGPGTVIGPYKLLEQIGEGGFGVVFMAEQQQPVRRKVAVKVIKPGMDTRQVIARFEAERQALALMDHPNIAHVLDAGETSTGRPYFVMELIRGIPVTDYCDGNQLTSCERLELFLAVCQAVQHAHQKGVIHRDLKPANILVTLHDGTPVPKVIDFGVAKAMGQQLTEKTLFTNFAQMIGTPMYMSPEQAALSGLDVDTRTDVYALGVLLYELLTSTTPFDRERLRTAAYDEILRIIREEEPPRPSKRLSTLCKTLTEASAQRKTDPKRLGQSVSGELDWIVMKALEKDRRRRYDTASALAADLQRYLANEPVAACPPSSVYRFRKFARRNKAALVTAGLVAVALVVGILVSSWQAVRATRAETLAEDRRQQAEHEGQLARQAELQARQAFEDANRQRARAEENLLQTQKAVDDYFTMVSQSELLNVPGLQPLRKQLLEAAVRYYQEFVKQRADDPKLRAALAAAYARMARIRSAIGSKSEAVADHEKARAIWEELRTAHPDNPEYAAGLASTYLNIGYTQEERQMATGEADYTRATVLLEELVRRFPARLDFQSALAQTYHNGGYLKLRLRNWAEAARLYGLALTIYEELRKKNPTSRDYQSLLAQLQTDLGLLNLLTKDMDQALRHYQVALKMREELVRQHPGVLDYLNYVGASHNHVGDVYRATRDLPAANAAYDRAIAIQEKLVGDNPTVTRYRRYLVNSYENLADIHNRAGRPVDARRLYEAAVDHQEQLVRTGSRVPDFDPDLLRVYRLLADTHQKLGKRDDAVRTYQRACRLMEELCRAQPESPIFPLALAQTHQKIGTLQQQLGQWTEALRSCEQATVILERLIQNKQAVGECQRELAQTLSERAWVEVHRKEYAQTITTLGRALELDPDNLRARNRLAWMLVTCPDVKFHDVARSLVLAKATLERAPQNGAYWHTLGIAHYRAGEWEAATGALKKSEELLTGRNQAVNSLFQAMAHWRLGEKEKAQSHYAQAMAWLGTRQGDEDFRRFRSEAAELLGVTDKPPPNDKVK